MWQRLRALAASLSLRARRVSAPSHENCESPVPMVATACKDYHNLGVDREGQVHSLLYQLNFNSFPGGP